MWVSDNGTFGFGFTSTGSPDELQLSIWYFNLPGDPTIVWSAKRDSPVGRDAYEELETTGNLALIDPFTATIVWASNTTGHGVRSAEMSDSGNFILYNSLDGSVWESFSHPSDTLLPRQPLTANLELTSFANSRANHSDHNGSYSLKMLQQPSSLSLSLSYISPNTSLNYSYWSGPQISNATGNVAAVLDDSGSFGVSYGSSSSSTVYVHKNDCDVSGCTKKETGVVLRRLVIGEDGNLRLYRWDVNGSRLDWETDWSTVSNPCSIAGVSGDGICSLENNMTNVSCTPLMGLSPPVENYCTHFEMEAMPQTKYCFSESLVIANYSMSRLAQSASNDVWRTDPSSTLFVKHAKLRWHRRVASRRSPSVPGAPLNFSYRDLQIATLNFPQMLGTGGFGSVYKGSFADGTSVAVKKLERLIPHGEESVTEVATIGSMHHMNLVRLCSEGSQRQENKHVLIVSGEHPLGRELLPQIGLAKLMGREHSHVVTMVRGTRGYLAPEWVSNRPITVKADVYSYGMRLLKIIGGRRNLDMSLEAEDFFYPGLAFKEMMSRTPKKAVDKRLLGNEEEEVLRAMRVGFWCIQEDVVMRPSMGEVVRMLEGAVEVEAPPMPPAVLELVEKGLDHVYKAMMRRISGGR
ncbi:G-type lectin S-receptor-like serine/threonine-protein kinase [Acorus calamus]|uniref:G-type lectin S-receptor-like serine/threonine-protein kinase n=1 Tax=Acorus calamus TaxID=4465 RepID=A0AAV9F8E4_ACOCL|nr:G-type lectin S-receptor-like serine/threonine-protein kinase [Acorus calamus]